ncbi:GFA family protein [Roseibium sp. MMSF_3544]|uniref:GFA family protein n=1 Tax=unclassified Roseibium TaxID=2629323 RepID=UPI00273DD322|nr:GFA family protein [Roseibium sp. MMSF_3544]
MIEGSCHCGAVHWRLSQRPNSATACSCTICRRYGALWAYGHIDHDIEVTGETKAYRREDGGDIDFHFCTNCGSITHYITTHRQENGRVRGAVNLRMSELGAVSDIPIRHFDGFDRWESLPRDNRTVKDLWF